MLKKLKKLFFRNTKNICIENLQIEPTTFCNLDCYFCWHTIDNTNKKAKEMSFETFKEVIDSITNIYSVKTLCLQGLGEPLICKDIIRMIRYAKQEKNLSVWFTSNGILLDEQNINDLIEAKTDKIRISLDSANSEINLKLNKKEQESKVAKAVTAINQTKKEKQAAYPLLAFNTIVTTLNLNCLSELIAFAKEHMISEITLIPLVVFKDEDKKYLVDFSSDTFKEKYATLKQEADLKGVDINLGVAPGNKDSRFCKSGLFADVEGNIHPCCNLDSVKFDKSDNLLDKKLQKFLKKTKNLTCAKCFDKHGN